MSQEQEVVLVPLVTDIPGAHDFRIERMLKSELREDKIQHIAKGSYTGIIVSKLQEKPLKTTPDTDKVYTAYIKDSKNSKTTTLREKRTLRFWFEPQAQIRAEIPIALTESFFKQLMNPNAFPKDYISYVIRLLTLVKQYTAIQKLEAYLRPLKDEEKDEGVVIQRTNVTVTTREYTGGTLPREGQDDMIQLADGTYISKHGTLRKGVTSSQGILQGGSIQRKSYLNGNATAQDDHSKEHTTSNAQAACSITATGVVTSPPGGTKVKRTLTLRGREVVLAARRQNVLTVLEDAYPNVMSVDDICHLCELKAEEVERIMEELGNKSLIKQVDKSKFIRMPPERKLVLPKARTSQYGTLDKRATLANTEDERRKHDFKMVDHIPNLPDKEQPTIAVVTLFFSEKLAVDSMMDYKTTYIRLKKGEGEGQVYTVGMIGKHRLVSTKLSRIGHKQDAMVAAGNNVTRLLGTFGKIEHILLVGVGGGVACLNDDQRHTRLGDVVVSKPAVPNGPVYIHCKDTNGSEFKTQQWGPHRDTIDRIVTKLRAACTGEIFQGSSWDHHMTDATMELKGGDMRFERPAEETNKPYRVKDGQEMELEPPMSPIGSPRFKRGDAPFLHLGIIGTGQMFNKDAELREKFVNAFKIRCMDSGFQAVLASIEGNRNESFAIIRGVADYQDGTHRREWQGYAALAAAAFMKAVVLELPHAATDSDEEDG